MSANQNKLVLIVQLAIAVAILVLGGGAISAAPLAADPIPGYPGQINVTNF